MYLLLCIFLFIFLIRLLKDHSRRSVISYCFCQIAIKYRQNPDRGVMGDRVDYASFGRGPSRYRWQLAIINRISCKCLSVQIFKVKAHVCKFNRDIYEYLACSNIYFVLKEDYICTLLININKLLPCLGFITSK